MKNHVFDGKIGSLMPSIMTSLFLSLTAGSAFAFTPSHQEACCLAMQRQESLDGLRCEGLGLTPELCKSIVAEFASAARAQHRWMSSQESISEDATDMGSKRAKHDGGGLSFSIGVLLVFAAAGVLIYRRIQNKSAVSFRPFLTMSLAVANTPLIFWLVGVCSSKVLCMPFGNLCSTGTLLIPIFLVSGVGGALISGSYLFRSWKHREAALRKNFFVLTLLALAIGAIHLSGAEIP